MHVGLNYIYAFHFLPVPLSPTVSRRGLGRGLEQAGYLVCGSRQRDVSRAGLQHRLHGPSWVWQLSRLLTSCPQREGEGEADLQTAQLVLIFFISRTPRQVFQL